MERFRFYMRTMTLIAFREVAVQSRYRNKFFTDVFSHYLGIAPILLITFALSGSAVDGSGISDLTRNQTLFVLLGYTAFMAFGFGTPLMLYTGMAWGISEEVNTGTLERNFLAPVPRPIIVLGTGLYYVVLYSFHVVSLVLLAVIFMSSDITLTGDSISISVLSIVGLLFFSTGLGVLAAGFYLTTRDSSFFLLVVHRPFMVLSGAIFVIELLPAPVEWIARINPVTYGIDAFRGSLSGAETLIDPWAEVAILYGSAAVVGLLGIWMFNWVVRRQMRTGDLTRY